MTRSIGVVVMARSIDVTTHQIIGGRDEQEDVILVAQCGRYTVAVIADGMGGHTDGKGAATCAAQAFLDYVLGHVSGDPAPDESLNTLPLQALRHANVALLIAQAGRRRSGTTLTGLLTDGLTCAWAHIGDTRLWYVADGTSQVVTSDMHVPSMPHVLLGCIPLGSDAAPPESGWFQLAASGGRLVLTSDGVHGGYQRDHDVWLHTPGRQDYWRDVTRGDGMGLVDVGDASAVVATGLRLSKVSEQNQDNASAIVLEIRP